MTHSMSNTTTPWTDDVVLENDEDIYSGEDYDVSSRVFFAFLTLFVLLPCICGLLFWMNFVCFSLAENRRRQGDESQGSSRWWRRCRSILLCINENDDSIRMDSDDYSPEGEQRRFYVSPWTNTRDIQMALAMAAAAAQQQQHNNNQQNQADAIIRRLQDLGFIVAATPTATFQGSMATPATVTLRELRSNMMSQNERLAVLERIISFEPYVVASARDNDNGEGTTKDDTPETISASDSGVPMNHDGVAQDGICDLWLDDEEEQQLPEAALTMTGTPHMCSICLDPFVSGDIVNAAVAPTKSGSGGGGGGGATCHHVFHKTCLLSWLDKHDVCPMCRYPMVTDENWIKAMVKAQERQRLQAATTTTTTRQRGRRRGEEQAPPRRLGALSFLWGRQSQQRQDAGAADGAATAGEAQENHGETASAAGRTEMATTDQPTHSADVEAPPVREENGDNWNDDDDDDGNNNSNARATD